MGTIDDYLSGLPADDARTIGRLYDLVRAEVPQAEQGTGYGMPALIYRGKPLMAIKRTQRHFGLYPFSPAAIDVARERLDALPDVSTDKGTIRLSPDSLPPEDLLRAVIGARRDQIDG